MEKEKTERILLLIKFGKKKHLESLLKKGELYFKTPKAFNDIKKNNEEQGDENEGAIWIKNLKDIKLTINHPDHGDFNFKSVPNKLMKLTQFNHNYLTCSFYAITTKDLETSNILKIDKRMKMFGDHALIITNTKIFVESVMKSAEKLRLKMIATKVTYQDLSQEGHFEINPFIKKVEHSHQKEYRMVIKNSSKPFLKLKVCKLGEKGKIIPTSRIEELTMEAKTKTTHQDDLF